MPLAGVLVAALLAGALGCVLIALGVAVRGRLPDPLRPQPPLARVRVALRSPLLSGCLAAAVVTGVLLLVVTGWPVAAVAMAGLIAFWPRLFGGARAERVAIARLEELVIWMESLRDTTAAHASLEQTIPASTVNAGPLMRPALVHLIGRIRARVPLDIALLRLAADLDDARSADPLIAALILNVRRRGDRLGQVLSGLAQSGRAELDFRRHVLANQSELRRGVQILVSITLAVALYLTLINRDFGRPYASAAGQVALLVVITLFVGGFWWLRRLSAPEPVLPFLPRAEQQIASADLRLVATITGTPTASSPSRGANAVPIRRRLAARIGGRR